MPEPARKVALITGAARGIGKGIAARLAPDYDVAISYNTTVPVTLPDRMRAYQTDLTLDGACADLIGRVIRDFGRLDVIVNNAGVVAPSPLGDHDWSSEQRIFDMNVLVPHALLSAALPHLTSGASVISISSVNAELPPKDAVLYGASKAALNLWTKGMAKELGPKGIRVNAIAPGAIEIPEAPRPDELTQAFVDLTALGRIGVPEDIAGAVAFLASEEASFITGAILPVSGGYRL